MAPVPDPSISTTASEPTPEEDAPSDVSDEDIETVAQLLAGGKVVAFTGAGISAESGIPTYRDPGGLWRKYDMKKVSHLKNFLQDPISCWRFELELYRLLRGVKPNAGHYALAELEAAGIVDGVITQNVEGLHTAAGSRCVVELHGNETKALCLRCGRRCSSQTAFRRVGWIDDDGAIVEDALPDVASILRSDEPDDDGAARREHSTDSSSSSAPSAPSTPASASTGSSSSGSSGSAGKLPRGDAAPKAGPGAPSCPHCGDGLLKPDAIYFGENLDTAVLKRAEKLFEGAGVALLVGSSCRVAPAYSLPLKLIVRGGILVDVNPNGSRLSPLAKRVLKGPSADVLPRLVKAVAACRSRIREGIASEGGMLHSPDDESELDVTSPATPHKFVRQAGACRGFAQDKGNYWSGEKLLFQMD